MSEKAITVDAAMKILLDSGEARKHITRAIEALVSFDHEVAERCLGAAQESVRSAHEVHTDVIHAEARGEAIDIPPTLLSHAQDTMMTTDSELRLVRRLIPVVRALDRRIGDLERTQSAPHGAVLAGGRTE